MDSRINYEMNKPAGEPPFQRAAAPAEPVLLDAIALLWRYKTLIFATAALAMLISALIVFQLTPRYTAEAQIFIGTRSANVVDIESVLQALRPDRTTMNNEVEVLSSRSLAEAVVDELGLLEKPEFNRQLRPPSLLGRLSQWLPQSLRATLSGNSAAAARTPEETARRVRDATVTVFSEALRVTPIRLSNVVSVTATSEEAELAALIANTLSEIYLRQLLDEKFAATEQASGWLNERVLDLREQVEQSERAVEAFRQERGLTQTSDSTLVEQQVSEVNSQLIAARATTSEAAARLRQARELMKSEGGIFSIPEVLSAPLIQNLRLQEASLVGESAQMAQEYGPRHPRMVNMAAELEDIRAKIGEEVERIVAGIENSLEVARTRERALEESLEELKAEADQLTSSQARLRVLEREAAANQALFDVFLARYMETGDQEELFSADARIISRAIVPTEQIWPNLTAAAGITLVASALLGLLAVFVAEQVFERGFRHSAQLETGLKVNSFGAVPMLDEAGDQLTNHVLENPMSAFSESLRMLHSTLLAAHRDEPESSSMLITSSVSNEGKTFLSISLARLIARGGRKTLLIDADLRHGQIAKRLGLSDETGLAHLLTGREKATQSAIKRDAESGLDVLTAGKPLNVRTDIIRQQSMLKLLDEFKSKYDLVIIDSPPLLLVSDALNLAKCVDATMYAVRWSATPRKVVRTGISQLLNAPHVRLAGAVLTMAQGNRKGYYAYGYGSYGYGPEPYGLSSKYSSYYTR